MLPIARWLAVFFLILLLAPMSTAVQARPLVIQLKWLHQFQSAGFYAALEKGFFADEGLEVELRERNPSQNIVTQVVNREADYGVGDATLLMYHAHGEPIVLVAGLMQQSAGAMMTMSDSGLVSPQDLVGKKVAFYVNDSDGIDVLTMLASQKIQNSDLVRVPWQERLDRLTTRQVDAVAVYTTMKRPGICGGSNI